jgi:hypothetical protein
MKVSKRRQLGPSLFADGIGPVLNYLQRTSLLPVGKSRHVLRDARRAARSALRAVGAQHEFGQSLQRERILVAIRRPST